MDIAVKLFLNELIKFDDAVTELSKYDPVAGLKDYLHIMILQSLSLGVYYNSVKH